MPAVYRLLRSVTTLAIAWALAGCNESSLDTATQIGADPKLPEPREYLFPSMHIASVVGWKEGETPTVAPELKIEVLAKQLHHPRSIYVLPNGDVLVVESKAPETAAISRPKDLVMKWIEAKATSGGGTQKSNRINFVAGRKQGRCTSDP